MSAQPNKKQPQTQPNRANSKPPKDKKEKNVNPKAEQDAAAKKAQDVPETKTQTAEAAPPATTSTGDQPAAAPQKSKADLRRERALIQEAQRAKKAAEGLF
jgi:hypothetical protein